MKLSQRTWVALIALAAITLFALMRAGFGSETPRGLDQSRAPDLDDRPSTLHGIAAETAGSVGVEAGRRQLLESVEGIVVVRSTDGSGSSPERGSLELEWTAGDEVERISVDVQNGRFRFAAVRTPASVTVRAAELDGARVVPLMAGVAEPGSDGVWKVTVASAGSVELRVVSSGDGLRPRGLHVFSGPHDSYYPQNYPIFPAPDPSRLEQIEVPTTGEILVHPPIFGECLYVHAPGHEWKMLAPSDFVGSVVEVILPRAAALDVRVLDVPGDVPIEVCLRYASIRSGSRYFVRSPVHGSDVVRFEAIPIGEYSVTVAEVGGPIVNAQDVLFFVAERREVELSWLPVRDSAKVVFQLLFEEPLPASARFDVVIMPQEWESLATAPSGRFQFRGLAPEVVAATSMVETERLDLVQGRYAVALVDHGFVEYVDVPAGPSEVPIVVPRARERSLRVLDSETGSPVPIRLASWVQLSGEELKDYFVPPGSASVFVPEGALEIPLRTPAGVVGIDLSTVTHGRSWNVVDIAPDQDVVELIMSPMVTVRVRPSVGDRVLRAESEWVERIQVSDSTGNEVSPVGTASIGSGGPYGESEGVITFAARGPVVMRAPGVVPVPLFEPVELVVEPGREYVVTFSAPD